MIALKADSCCNLLLQQLFTCYSFKFPTDKKAAQNDEAVQTAVKKVAEGLGDTGRILVRESGTEPVVRVMVEAPDHDTCQKYVSEVVDVIRDRGYSL